MNTEKYLDIQCIFIDKNLDKDGFIDYIYTSNVWGKDPRYKNRNMIVGQVNGLFRINKETLEVTLLREMELDSSKRCYLASSCKIIKIYRAENEFPEKATFQSG